MVQAEVSVTGPVNRTLAVIKNYLAQNRIGIVTYQEQKTDDDAISHGECVVCPSSVTTRTSTRYGIVRARILIVASGHTFIPAPPTEGNNQVNVPSTVTTY